MLRYDHIAQNETKFLALTGLTDREFQDLVPVFQTRFETVLREQTMDGLDRIGRAYTPYRNSPLPTIEDKLLFILVYLKQYPTHAGQGHRFGLSQSTANQWIHLLHSVVNQALAAAGYLLQRTALLSSGNQVATSRAAPAERPLFSMMEPNDP